MLVSIAAEFTTLPFSMILETLINLIAPHDCFICGREGLLVCDKCWWQNFPVRELTRYTLGAQSSIGSIYSYAVYDGYVKKLMHRLKFERSPAAAAYIASALSVIPAAEYDYLVPVRTSMRRNRQRGYDQTVLIAQHLVKKIELPLLDILWHRGTARQLGASRTQRLAQIRQAFEILQPTQAAGTSVLLLDDVMTTGATLEAAADALRRVGAVRVDGLVFARA